MKRTCQKCEDRATFHITEIDETGYVEVDLCYKCAQQYLQETEEPGSSGLSKATDAEVAVEAAEQMTSDAQCPVCRLTFDEFRSTGRLGCPCDYTAFGEVLRPLLENIHGGVRHIGKVPRRLPAEARLQTELIQLRQELQQAVAVEDYERAARLRDQIDTLQAEKN